MCRDRSASEELQALEAGEVLALSAQPASTRGGRGPKGSMSNDSRPSRRAARHVPTTRPSTAAAGPMRPPTYTFDPCAAGTAKARSFQPGGRHRRPAGAARRCGGARPAGREVHEAVIELGELAGDRLQPGAGIAQRKADQ